MSAEEDNFDIDIYGDGGGEEYQAEETPATETSGGPAGADAAEVKAEAPPPGQHEQNYEAPKSETEAARHGTPGGDSLAAVGSTGTPVPPSAAATAPPTAPQAAAPPTHGLKRKEGPDDRPTDPGATAALFLSDLHWWITDDDVRGWAHQSGCEDELHEVTFSEHKVNGKSKGQAYVLFAAPQAATAVKHRIEAFGDSGPVYKQRFAVTFSNPLQNPFKTLPKDGNNRRGGDGGGGPAGGRAYNNNNNHQGGGAAAYNQGGGYRGRGGGYNNNHRGAGGMGGGMGGGGYGGRGGYQQPAPPPHPLPGSYQGGGGGYPPQGGMSGPPYGGFQGGRGGMMGGGGGMRGGNMGMRGGRGGGQMNGMMGGMPMGMGGMPAQMGMGMAPMNGGMGMQGFPNPGFFPQQQQPPQDANWNPHGAKRTRQE